MRAAVDGDEARSVAADALAVCRASLCPERELTLMLGAEVAMPDHRTGALSQAVAAQRQVVRSARRLWGAEHPLTRQAAGSLAVMLSRATGGTPCSCSARSGDGCWSAGDDRTRRL
ncbi:hypothetical protein ABZ208_10750 [Streptomyces sp. NPDC006208]|uniref:hypothetical protein n=1 Tax=Streptomyces sp. NPDC006208 TaxID=3156734 RepID=UPI00339EFE64